MQCGKCKRETSMGNRRWVDCSIKRTEGHWVHRICPKRRGAKKIVRVAIKGVDLEQTAKRKFKHPKSRVMLDGREILYGLDYKGRVREVLERDDYKCQRMTLGGICAAPAGNHPHHLIKRSKLRDDRRENLSSRCDDCNLRGYDHPEQQTRFGKEKAAAL